MDFANFHTLHFPKDFLFGSAVASFQVENPDPTRYTDWDKFIHQHPEKHIIRPGEAGPDWWDLTKAKRDIDTMKSLGTNSFRLSLEWARIEPQPGVFNPDAILKYKELILFAKSKDMTPIVTLNHFTLPEWIQDCGSWTNKQTVVEFEKYVEYVLPFLPEIPYFVTLNEPNGLVISAYLTTYFPPGKGTLIATWQARNNMIEAHKRAHRIIKRHHEKAKVGIAYALMWYRPEHETNQFERGYTYIVNFLNATNWMRTLQRTSDFLGVNFYSGYYLSLSLKNFHLTTRKDSAGIPKTILLGQTKRPGAYNTDMGWPIVPDFFLSLLRSLYKSYHKPILITENGLADVQDKYRAFYIFTHLVAMWKAMDERIPIMGYTYWSTIDNLEWLFGFTRQFGLIGYNALTHERHLRKSSELYKEVIRTNEVSIHHLLKEYIPSDQHQAAQKLIDELLTAGKRNPRIQYQNVPEELPEKQKTYLR